ncbi:MAG TPA: helix-turn-helix transcriptional regulator [Pyrinomonadaceae bacterium]|jgi:DNA-binding PadR family transcriptional regulator
MATHKTDLLPVTLELLVLRILWPGRLNSWDIMQRIRIVSRDVLNISPGALYPALHRLEERGLVSSAWGRSRITGGQSFTASLQLGREGWRWSARHGSV